VAPRFGVWEWIRLRAKVENNALVAGDGGRGGRWIQVGVAGLRPGIVSVMPQGLDEQVSRQELADLLAFLKSRRPSGFGAIRAG